MTASSELPKGWCETPLGKAVAIEMGQSPPGHATNEDAEGLPLLGGAADFSESGLNATRFTSEPRKVCSPGDLVICIRATIGKPRVAEQEFCLGRGVAGLRPGEAVTLNWLRHFFVHSESKLLEQGTGSTFKQVSKKILEAFPLRIPPLNEQRRIVAKIEDLTARSRNAKQALDAIPPLLERFRQSVLAAAFRGDLTKQWRQQNPNTEPASELLKRIRQERRHRWEQDYLQTQKAEGKEPKDNKWKQKYQEPEAVATAGLPELPEGWCWASMGEAFEVCVGATPSRKRPDYWGGSIPWVSSGEVAFCRISSTRETITEDGLKNSSTSLQPPGTLLIGMIGEGKTRGQVAILDIEACNNQNAAAIRVSMTPIPTEYVYRYLEGQYQATRLLGSGNNQQALNKTRVQAMVIPIAPLAEQEAICAELETLLSRADAINEFTDNSSDKMHMLNQSILAKAFRGELVPQDPNDEPASALLERIRAERGAKG